MKSIHEFLQPSHSLQIHHHLHNLIGKIVYVNMIMIMYFFYHDNLTHYHDNENSFCQHDTDNLTHYHDSLCQLHNYIKILFNGIYFYM